ncbi:MAG: hypothetical protein M3198_09280 [Actinomycetota bacterium]|nr:hypothetical protein [Actinomycetota bacterium]
MAERPEEQRANQYEETDSFTGGPGVVATKSQARGSIAGVIVGAIVGALIGLVIGLLADVLVVGIVVGAVGGSVVGGVAGGGQNAKRARQNKPDEADL